MDEHLTKVTSEGQLQAGALVLLKDCTGLDDEEDCGRDHRTMLLGAEDWPESLHGHRRVWRCAPGAHGAVRICCTCAIEGGRLYLIDTGLTHQDLVEEQVAGMKSAPTRAAAFLEESLSQPMPPYRRPR